MTIKEAILRSLDDINRLTNYMEVHDHIIDNNYFNFARFYFGKSQWLQLLTNIYSINLNQLNLRKNRVGLWNTDA